MGSLQSGMKESKRGYNGSPDREKQEIDLLHIDLPFALHVSCPNNL
jgi:hypothetical protein